MRQRTKKDECNKRLWHVFVLLNIRLWNYYSLMCSNCGCCYVTTTDHYHSKRHTLKNTHSIIEKPCETQTDNLSHVLGCFNVSRKKKKDRMKKSCIQLESGLRGSLRPPHRAALEFICLIPGQGVWWVYWCLVEEGGGELTACRLAGCCRWKHFKLLESRNIRWCRFRDT